MIDRHRSALGLGDYSGYTWNWDQKLLSRMILESRLCTVPRGNRIWDLVRLSPPAKDFDDSKTCFHGMKVRVNPLQMWPKSLSYVGALGEAYFASLYRVTQQVV